jgi:tetratricopeptide (TPR) repeat protein
MGGGRISSRRRFVRGQSINPAALRRARLDGGLTLAQAAEGIVTRQALHQFESGQARPALRTLEAIARRLDIPLDGLLDSPSDPREVKMRQLQERQQWRELRRTASGVLADPTISPHMHAVACFYFGRAVLDQAPDEALIQFRRAGRQLTTLSEPWLAAEARDWEGVALYLQQRPEALEVGRDALTRYRSLTDRDPGVEARMLEHIGTYQLHRQELAEALASYRQAIAVAGSRLDLLRLANVYHGLASGCLRLGNTRQSMDYFERAVSLSRTAHDVRGTVTANLARLENDYGDMLLRIGRWERAEEMIRAALDHFEALAVQAGRSYALLSLGDLKHRQGFLHEAMRWTNQAIEAASLLGETTSLAMGYQQLGELWADLGDSDRFDASFSRALAVLEYENLPERRAEVLRRYECMKNGSSTEVEKGS